MVVAASKPGYHHGNLPDSLRAATAELVAEKGASSFSLREVARRAGVSHAAPAHHFGDAEGLLTSLAAEGYSTLADALEEAAASSDDPEECLLAGGRAYIKTAFDNPGHFAVMMAKDRLCQDNDDLACESARAYEALQVIVTKVRDGVNPDLDIDAACTFCWSAVEGLVQLSGILDDVADDMGTTKATVDQNIEAFARFMVHGMSGEA